MRFAYLLPALATLACAGVDASPPPDALPALGQLVVSAAGLPTEASLEVRVTGPGAYDRVHHVPTTLDSLPPGEYSVISPVVPIGSTIFEPATLITQTTLVAGRTASVALVFHPVVTNIATGRLELGASGLPDGAVPDFRVIAAAGTEWVPPANGVLDSLPTGVYTLRAAPHTANAVQYVPDQETRLVAVATDTTVRVVVAFRQLLPSGLPAHPRVWMNPTRVDHLRAQASANSVRWQRVKTLADAQVAKGTTLSGAEEHNLPALCATYLGTGDPKYAVRAGRILEWFAVPGNNLQYDSGYPYRFWLPLVSIGLDWCYEGLTPAQRRQAAGWLMDRADWVWPETNPARTGAWGLWASNNYFWGFMTTGPAALAAAGEDIGSHPVSGTDRPAYHIALATRRWNDNAAPYFRTEGAGGAWKEGTNYDSSWFVGRFVDAFLTAGRPFNEPWLAASLQWRLHSTMPGGRYKALFGVQPRSSDATMFTYDRFAALDILPSANAGSELTGQIQHWLDWIGQVPTGNGGETATMVEELLRYDPVAPKAATLTALPLHYLATGTGFFVSRESWSDPAALAWTFEAGIGVNNNGLQIWDEGSWVSASANLYSISGIESWTQTQNNVTVAGVGQRLYTTNLGQMVTTAITPQLQVIRGQAKDSYGLPGQRPMTDYLRTVAYLPDLKVFVVVDRVTATLAASPKVWRWHGRNPIAIQGNGFVLANPAGTARCFGTVLAPGDAVLANESFNLAGAAQPSSHAVTVTVAGRSTDVGVTVLECTSGTTRQLSPIVSIADGVVTVTVTGGTTVRVPLAEQDAVTRQ